MSAKSQDSRLSESEFLARQAADAKAAIQQTLTEMKHVVLEVADPRPYIRDYPVMTLCAAAGAGFVTSLLSPRGAGKKLLAATWPLLRAARPLARSATKAAAAAVGAAQTAPQETSTI